MKLIILGPPGSGKGTVSELLVKHNKFFHIAAGDLLREEVKKGTKLGKEIQRHIDQGHLVPPSLPIQLIKPIIMDKKKYILDGFPRSLEQAKTIERWHINHAIYLKIDENAVIKRLAGRRTCEKGHSYHPIFHPPKKQGICDIDGTKLTRRKDDNPKIIKERFKIFYKQTMPVLQYYRKKGILKIINANDTPRKVYEKIITVIND